ncbi:MAG: hypothetical protein IJE93_08620 [Clostridia bacterium]|nr:hypothetical protein [Clostridia bacterium]
MNKEILQKILQTESVSFSSEEIQQMLDEELEKSPEEMDAQFIDLCVDVLSKKEVSEEKVVKKNKKTSPKKLLLVAAVIVILMALAIPVSAELPAIKSQGGVIKVLENYISVNLTGGKEYNLSQEFRDYNIPDYVIPSFFFGADCTVTDSNSAGDNTYRFEVKLSDLNTEAHITLTKVLPGFDFGYNYIDIYAQVEQMEQFTINGIDVFVYSAAGETMVIYVIENYNTRISFSNLKFDKAVEIMEEFLSEMHLEQ